MASQKAFGRFSLKQLYDFIKAKGAQVVTDFNHDPAKNANSVILKSGTGNTTENASGKVQGGYVYYLCNGMWSKTDYTKDPQPMQDNSACGGLSTGGSLSGIALGDYGEYSGTPEQVGMLIQGVTTTVVNASGLLNIGDRLFVTAVNDLNTGFGIDVSGTLTAKNRQHLSATPKYGNLIRPMGYVIDVAPDYKALGIGYTQYRAVCLIQQSPVVSYYGYPTGSAVYQSFQL